MSMMINDKKECVFCQSVAKKKFQSAAGKKNSDIVNSSWKIIAYFVKHMGKKLSIVNQSMKNSQISFNCCVVMENNRIFPQALVGEKLWISSITQWKYHYFIKLLWKRIADFFSLSWKKEIWNFVNYAKKNIDFISVFQKQKSGILSINHWKKLGILSVCRWKISGW